MYSILTFDFLLPVYQSSPWLRRKLKCLWTIKHEITDLLSDYKEELRVKLSFSGKNGLVSSQFCQILPKCSRVSKTAQSRSFDLIMSIFRFQISSLMFQFARNLVAITNRRFAGVSSTFWGQRRFQQILHKIPDLWTLVWGRYHNRGRFY